MTIRWTDLEKTQIVQAAGRIKLGEPEVDDLALFRRAMRVLPAHRRRAIPTVGAANYDWFHDRLPHAVAEAGREAAVIVAEAARKARQAAGATETAETADEDEDAVLETREAHERRPSQMCLVTAIAKELERQGFREVNARQFNAIIAAADTIVWEMRCRTLIEPEES